MCDRRDVRRLLLVSTALASLVWPHAAHAEWGGRTTTPAGEPVTIRLSDAYPRDPALQARWAAFLGSLVHGPEISTVNVYVAPDREVRRLCGFAAAACYSDRERLIVTPGTDLGPTTSAEAVLAHEYGHHVGASRQNAPWRAVDYGTKRWASHVGVCSAVRERRLFPGAAGPGIYSLNAAEVFAESFRVLNERRLNRAETPWRIVSTEFYPSDPSLALLEQDIRDPWTGPTTVAVRGAVGGTTRIRTHAVATTLDGELTVSLRAPRSARLRVDVLDDGGHRLAGGVAGGGRTVVRTTVCGSRSHSIRITRVKGAGPYSLTVSRP